MYILIASYTFISYLHSYKQLKATYRYRMEGKFGELTRFEHLAKESLAN